MINLRFFVAVIGLFVLSFISSIGGGIAVAQMTPMSSSGAQVDNLSLCGTDTPCLEDKATIKKWICAAALCDAADKSKAPITCFENGSHKFSIQVTEQINEAMCPLIKSPSKETRQALTAVAPDVKEDELVEFGAYLMAFKGSAVSGENYIKSFVGPYGPQWNHRWYKALARCRMLAHETTSEQELKDFNTWRGVLQGVGHCSDIVNGEMRTACSAPHSGSPLHVEH